MGASVTCYVKEPVLVMKILTTFQLGSLQRM